MRFRRLLNVLGVLATVTIHPASFFRLNLIHSKTFSSDISNQLLHLAIDGDTNTCSITELNSTSEEHSWWSVELDRDHNVTDLSIYFIPDYIPMSQLTVYVSSKADDLEEHLCITSKDSRDISSGKWTDLVCKEPAIGKFVTIKREGRLKKKLVLCEVNVYANRKTVNLALWRPTFHSGIQLKYQIKFSVDNMMDTCEVIRSHHEEFAAWWRVVLDESYYITDVNIYLVRRFFVGLLQYDLEVYVSNDNGFFNKHLCGFTTYPNNTIDKVKKSINLTCSKPTPGTYVTIAKYGNNRPELLTLCEVEIFSKEDPKEINNTETTKNCLAHEYGCYQGHCINLDLTCDGTEDCPYGDDERGRTCLKCDVGKFKCKKRYFCVDNATRCDGKRDCPDYSDEMACFKINGSSTFLTATYKGESNYHICSQDWKTRYSITVCNQIQRHHRLTKFAALTDETQKYLILNASRISADKSQNMESYYSGSICETKEFVQIICVLRVDKETTSLCGTRGFTDDALKPYIIRGEIAKEGAWPWHAQVYTAENKMCGGSIVDEDWILTAAHCLKNTETSNVTVKVGTLIIKDARVKSLPISFFVSLPGYDDKAQRNDVALIRLKSPITFTNLIRPICLPKEIMGERKLMSFRHCILSGFGHSDKEGNYLKYLQQGRMNIMSSDECAKEMSKSGSKTVEQYKERFRNDHLFCAGSIPTRYGTSLCKGDGGGPLVCKDEKSVWTQVGIAKISYNFSNVPRCSNSVFTKVDEHLDFITEGILSSKMIDELDEEWTTG